MCFTLKNLVTNYYLRKLCKLVPSMSLDETSYPIYSYIQNSIKICLGVQEIYAKNKILSTILGG